jgi:hypothetical protein
MQTPAASPEKLAAVLRFDSDQFDAESPAIWE